MYMYIVYTYMYISTKYEGRMCIIYIHVYVSTCTVDECVSIETEEH